MKLLTEQEGKLAYRLAGICKKCHNFRFGYLLYGRGPFICYQCAEQAAKIPAATDTPGGLYFSYTFTTSNSTSSTWGDTRI